MKTTSPATYTLPRSPELMSRDDTALLVVDVQEKLIGLIPGHERIVWNIRRLIDSAELLSVPVVATEQYPKGLGHTIPPLAERLGEVPDKLTFSCSSCTEVFAPLVERGVHRFLVVGIEAHVCVQQTVLDLLAAGHRVYVAADAVGSRFADDREFGLRRMETCGAVLTTTESALFEWCERSDIPEFKTISQLVRETAPGE